MAITEKQILEALRPVQDPELRRSIVELGFVKNIRIEGGTVRFDLELTTPACPLKGHFQKDCEQALLALPGVERVDLNFTARTRGRPAGGESALAGVKNILAVASGKGGVAKSTTSVNVALSLQMAGARVGLLDADIYGPSLPTMLPIEAGPQVHEDGTIVPAMSLGMKVVSMGFFMRPDQAAIMRGPMVSGYVMQFLSRVEWGELDYLIIDYPPGTGDIQLTLSQQAPITGALITTTPQDISLVDVRKAIAMFDRTKVTPVGVVETMSYFVCDGCNKRHDIFRSGGGKRIAEATGIPLLGEIPIDPRVAEGGDEGAPIVRSHPEAPAAVAYRELASAVASRLAVLHMQRGDYLETFALDWKA